MGEILGGNRFHPSRPLTALILLSVPNLAGFGYQSELELRVAEAARRQYNKLKMQTKAEIRQTLDRLLVGDFIVSEHAEALLGALGEGAALPVGFFTSCG